MMYRELVAFRFLDNVCQFSVDTGLKIMAGSKYVSRTSVRMFDIRRGGIRLFSMLPRTTQGAWRAVLREFPFTDWTGSFQPDNVSSLRRLCCGVVSRTSDTAVRVRL